MPEPVDMVAVARQRRDSEQTEFRLLQAAFQQQGLTLAQLVQGMTEMRAEVTALRSDLRIAIDTMLAGRA